MAKFKPKPIVIEAMQLTWSDWNDICDFAGVGKTSDGKPEGCYIGENDYPTESVTEVIGLTIPTPEGVVVACQNDWIIKGINEGLIICKPDIFEATYEPAE